MPAHKVIINWKEVDQLCQMQATMNEIAEWFHCAVQTIENKCQKEQHMGFPAYFDKHSARGKISLRRNLFKLSESNVAAAIFLAKNYLGMSDKQEIEHHGITNQVEDLTDAQLAAIITTRRSKRTSEAETSSLPSD